MNLDYEAEILYLYIVEGFNMHDVAIRTGTTQSVVSETIHKYGFNKVKQSAYSRGFDCGRYSPGKPAARGLRITEDIIYDFLCEADDWHQNFERYVADIARDVAEERRQQEYERARQKAYEVEQERKRRAAQAERERIDRENRERQLALERQRREEEAKRKAEQAERALKYNTFIESGKRLLNHAQYSEAYNKFISARACRDTYETCVYIAQALACLDNFRYANEIISELTRYKELLKKNDMDFSASQHMWLARAYLAVGNKIDSCDEYFRCGDFYYDDKNYKMADKLYTEGRLKTGYYSGKTPYAAFKIAYARINNGNNPTTEDRKYAIRWYTISIDNNQHADYANANIALLHFQLKNFALAVVHAKKALDLNFHKQYVYKVLVNSQIECNDYDDALETLEKMRLYNFSYEPWIKAFCLHMSIHHSDKEAEYYYLKQLQINPCHTRSLKGLTEITEDTVASVQYGIRYLKSTTPQEEGHDYTIYARSIYLKARETEREDLIALALEFNPEEKLRLAEQEKARKEESRRAIEEAVRKLKESSERRALEEQQRKAAEEARLKAEEEARIKAEEEEKRQKQETEAMLLTLIM